MDGVDAVDAVDTVGVKIRGGARSYTPPPPSDMTPAYPDTHPHTWDMYYADDDSFQRIYER